MYVKRLIAAALMMAAAGIANAAVIAELEDVTNDGGFFAEVRFEDTATGVVRVTADIAPPINVGLTQGDILGLWLDISDESVLSGPRRS